MESTRKLSNLKIQWTKTLYQNNFKYIAFFLHFQGLKIFGARENNVKFRKITPYTLIFRILTMFSQFLRNLRFIFSDSHEKSALVLLHLEPLKNVKMQYSLNYSVTRFLSTEN